MVKNRTTSHDGIVTNQEELITRSKCLKSRNNSRDAESASHVHVHCFLFKRNTMYKQTNCKFTFHAKES